MNKPWRTILQRARLSLIVLASAIALSLAMVLGSGHVRDGMQRTLMQSRAQTSAQQAGLVEKQQDLAYVETHIGAFRTLRKQGLLSTPDRENWAEQLLAARRHLGLPDTLTFLLPPAAGAEPKADGATGGEETGGGGGGDGDGAGDGAVLTHDLQIELRDIHEEELLALLREFQTRIDDRFRVQSCRLSGPSESGLTAQCTLRFFTLPPASDGATAAAGTT